MKARNVLLLLTGAAVVGVGWLVQSDKPPQEAAVIESFNKHRVQYEELKTMMNADEDLKSVAEWGVETTASPLAEVPPKGNFPVVRFQQYLSLLKAIGAKRAGQTRGSQPALCFGIWGSGFAGDTRHVEVCSVGKPPANQVASLDTFYKSPKPRTPVYKHIQGDWYIWADW